MRIATRIIIAILFLTAAALATGWTWQRVAEHRDDQRHPPPGSLHSVHGRLMHLHCRGTGSPTILVEQGIGGPSIDWNEINDRMAHITRVCDYDRAGMGYSEPACKPTRAIDVAANLHALLAAASIDDDLVLIGWSAGGLYAREYHRQFPDRVKGLILVDSPHEQALARMPPQPSNQENLDGLMRKHHLARFGWLRLNGEIDRMFANAPVTEEDRARLIAIFKKSHTWRTLADEGIGLEQDLARSSTPPSLGDLPVIVIAEGAPRHPYMKDNLAIFHQLQQELADLSTDGKLVIATNSAHFIHRTEPALILRAAEEVVTAARTRLPLTAARPSP